MPVGDDGVVIGTDAEGRPAVLGVNRPTAYAVTLIGSLWTAQVLALRVAATGARVAVETGRAAAWAPIAELAGGQRPGGPYEEGPPCLTVHGVGRAATGAASAACPVFVVRDCGARPPRGPVRPAAWQSVLTLLPYPDPGVSDLIGPPALVGIQRVAPDEADRLGRILRLSRAETESLPTLADGVTLWCAGQDRRLVLTRPTDVENGLLGGARRIDPTT